MVDDVNKRSGWAVGAADGRPLQQQGAVKKVAALAR
jgi:hypothetical protein